MSGLKYRILWVDDNIETYIDLEVDKDFELFLQDQGFHPEIKKFETAENALVHLQSDRKFDLIISDLNLTGGEGGDSLIKKIREGEIYTEILFYSAQPGFDETAKELYKDRVSFLSLVGDEGNRLFKEKVKWLISLTVSKLQELNNVRGLVMAETSELDVLIEEILIEIMSEENELTKNLRKYMVKKVEENNKFRKDLYEEIDEIAHSDLIKNRTIFDANKKSRILNEFFKKSGLVEKENSLKNFHNNYKEQVLKVRNDLAHAKSKIIDGIEYLIISRKDGDQTTKIDQQKCIEIRSNLRKYSELLIRIRSEML